MGLAEDLIRESIKSIPQTPEDAYSSTRPGDPNEIIIPIETLALGNMWDRLIGFGSDRTLEDLVNEVDAKGKEANSKVAPRSFIGAIVRYLRTLFLYGDFREKDNDAIYNTKLGNRDIDDAGEYPPGVQGLKTGTLQGSVLYNRIENTIKYFAKKTQEIFKLIDSINTRLETIKEELANFGTTYKNDKEKNEENSTKTSEDLTKLIEEVNALKTQSANATESIRLIQQSYSEEFRLIKDDIKKIIAKYPI